MAAAIYEFGVKDNKGVSRPFSEIISGKVALVVNTASNCGFTPQYEGLQALHEQYKDKGFTVVG